MSEQNIQELSFYNVIGDRFGRYSKYIIQDRALPDIRDGLKPVQRRILYAMYVEGNTSSNPYRKSAKTVGNVIGNYHPHGDTSVYDAMVRMAQDWKNREPLVDMHGNKGSMDGDPPAAMRYTEARLTPIADELLRDIRLDTVDHQLNFDDSLEEPVVLPARFPNLLVNGATGISAGYATDIPPHNLAEVIDAVIHILTHEEYTLADLMQHVKGPDFPTGAIIQGQDDLIEAYETGRGKVVVRSVTEIEKLKGNKQQIVVTEIPYEVNKAKLIQKIDDIRLSGKIDGIADVRDESDMSGVRIAIELKRDVDAQGVLNYLLKNTELQANYNFNMVAIHDNRPELVGLATMLEAYIDHQFEIIRRRTQYQLNKAEDRLHIVDGLISMVSVLDQVIEIIRGSQNKSDAKQNLMAEFDFSEPQAEAIVTLQLYRLTNTDVTVLQNERMTLNEEVTFYKKILGDDQVLKTTLVQELTEIKEKYGNPRRTQLEAEVEEIDISTSLLVPDEKVVVSVTKEGYIKRTSLRSFSSSDSSDLGSRDLDYALYVDELSTHDVIILLTSQGNYIYQPVNELADIRWKDMGRHISQTVKMNDGETIVAAFQSCYRLEEGEVNDLADYRVVLVTQQGMVKQTPLVDFNFFRSYKSRTSLAMKFKQENDQLVSAYLIKPDNQYHLFYMTYKGLGLYYDLDQISEYGLKAQGVIGIKLREGDHVAAAFPVNQAWKRPQVMALTQKGHIKRFDLTQAANTDRATQGSMILKELKSDPHRVIGAIRLGDETIPVTVLGDTGYESVFSSTEIPITERYNNGSGLAELDKLGQVLDIHPAHLALIDENK